MIFDGRNSRSICADSCSNYSLSRYCTSVTGKHCTDSKKTSHWEAFLESILLFVSQGGFSLTEKQIENKFSIWSLLFLPIKDWAKLPVATEQSSVPSPAKAPDDKGCRTLRSATKDAVFGICELFSKSSTQNFSFALSKLFCFNCPSLHRRRIALVLSQKVQPD